MTDPTPLLIIMGTIVALVVIQRALTRIEKQPAGTRDRTVPPPTSSSPPSPSPSPSPKPKPRGLPLFPGLSAIGLDERGVEQLKSLVSNGDNVALTAFLANHRPGILELDEYLKQLRATFNAALPDSGINNSTENIRNTLKTFTPPEPPADIHFEMLSESEYEACLLFNPNSQRLVTRELMAQFGGQKFSEYFEFYCTKNISVAMHVPPVDPDRKTMETLAESGAANKGRHIPLATRLTVLKMQQIRQMCKDLNHDTKYTRKQDATEALAQIPGAAVLLSMSYVVDDLFALNPIKDEIYDIKREWNYLSAYAKLLTSRMNLNRAPAND
jgi:hypothetical protein